MPGRASSLKIAAGGGGGAWSDAFGDREDRVGEQSVGLAVYRDRSLGVRCLDQAEDPAVGLVDPVRLVVDAVPPLGLQVGLVGLGDAGGLDRARHGVDVHE